MRLDAYLASATKKLSDTGSGTARLDALVLLEDCLETDRAQLLAHPEIELTAEQLSVLNQQISKRSKHVPLAYIRGKSEFYGRQFIIDEHVLEPRPESEMIVDVLKSLDLPENTTIIDVGTGSGALAVTAQLELPKHRVIALDIDADCLQITRKNASALHSEIGILQGDLLEPIASTVSGAYVLLCNLPYVPENFHINQAATHEPRLAIFGGKDGLDVYRRLYKQLDSFSNKPVYIITEALPPQHDELAGISQSHGFTEYRREDFIQVFRPA